MNTTANYLPDDVLSTGEVAKLCAVNFRTVIRWAEKGLLPSYRLPGRGDYRVKVADLRQFLLSNQMPVPAAIAPLQRKALVIDDEPAMAAAIERCLKRAGFEVATATSGFAAGLMVPQFGPSLITLDLRMPALDGFAVLELLAHTRLPVKPKVLVISADSEARLAESLQRGADMAIAKPFTNEQLLEAINKMLFI